MLSPVAATNEALHAQLNDLRRDLQQAQVSAALLPQEVARADEAQVRCRRLEADAATTSGQTSRLEDRLRSTEQKLQEAQGACRWLVTQLCCAMYFADGCAAAIACRCLVFIRCSCLLSSSNCQVYKTACNVYTSLCTFHVV